MGVVIVPSTPTRRNRIKQLSEPQERTALDHWLLGRRDTGANDFVEHPRRDTPSRVVGKFHIEEVPLTASATKHFEFLTEQRMMGIENLCGFR